MGRTPLAAARSGADPEWDGAAAEVTTMWDQGMELLGEGECLDLLARATVGRVAVTVGALPAIFPVNFALSDGAVVFRTGDGTKLAAATDQTVLAFEVDDWDPMEQTGWSVLALGRATVVEDPDEAARLRRLPLAPWAGGTREHFVRMPIEFVSGRRIEHAAAAGPGRP
jgi:uncharacterized protein